MKKAVYVFIFSILTAVVLGITTYLINIHSINRQYHDRYNPKIEVALRKFPYPYRAGISICSDIDNTETLEEFLEIQRFLNTREVTSMGNGVGLEIDNSFLFYEPPDRAISYFVSSPAVRGTIIGFIKSGQIGVMHSYGKKSGFTREDSIRALGELKKNNCKIDVWVDHNRSMSNLGDDVTFGMGDHPNSKAYHADLTLNYGIKFVWLGRVTMITGQSVPITTGTFTSLFDSEHPLYSLINISKEIAKNALGVFGSKKYSMHKDNGLVRVVKLDDGHEIYEFTRFDNFWEGVATGATNKRLAYVLSERTLSRLKDAEGYMVVYTHLGKNSDCMEFICKETQNALRNLAKEFQDGNIYVTTTSKLLNYYIKHKYLEWSYDKKGDEIIIYIQAVKDPVLGKFIPSVRDLEGITFYVPNRGKASIYLDSRKIEKIRGNTADYTKRESVTVTSRSSGVNIPEKAE
jgi:hypothetical protein